MMNKKKDIRQYRAGMAAFLLSGFCAISAGIVVSILRDLYQFSYSISGSLISVMSIGNMCALLAAGVLPGFIGERATTILFCSGYFLGYLFMALTGNPIVLFLAFLIVGMAKGCTANKCTVLVGNNTDDRARALSLMNAWFALGALVCPFLIAHLQKKNDHLPMIGVSISGLILWFVFLYARMPGKASAADKGQGKTDYSFLKSSTFWLLALLLFCQNAAEYTVNGWVVTYYKSEQILTGAAAAYTVTVQWTLTLIARLLLSFVIKIRKPYKMLAVMGAGMTVMYAVLLCMTSAIPALIVLGLFAFSLAGIYPLAVAGVGEMMSSASVGIVLAIGGVGGILFPWLVGIIADAAGLRTGMAVNLIPCAGIIVIPFFIHIREERKRISKRKYDR